MKPQTLKVTHSLFITQQFHNIFVFGMEQTPAGLFKLCLCVCVKWIKALHINRGQRNLFEQRNAVTALAFCHFNEKLFFFNAAKCFQGTEQLSSWGKKS